MIRVLSRKYYSQFVNGDTFGNNLSDYTNFLLANIGEKIQVVTRIECYWQTIGQQYTNEFQITTDTTYDTITRASGSFLTDGFSAGDTVTVRYLNGTWQTATATISTVNDREMVITTISMTTGYPTPAYNFSIYGTTKLYSMLFKFNLIENTGDVTFASLIDNSEQSYYINGIGTGSPRSVTAVNGVKASNYNSLVVDDSIKVAYVSTGAAAPYSQIFDITFTFRLTPLFLAEQYSAIFARQAPEYFAETKCLKPVFYYEMRQTQLNPNTQIVLIDEGNKGNTGWFNENFNAFLPAEYSVDSIEYTKNSVVVDSLQSDAATHIKIILSSTNNLFSHGNTKYTLNVMYLPIEASEYQLTQSTLFENFVFDSYFGTIGGSSGAGINSILSNISSVIASDKLVIEADVTYTTAQQAIINSGSFAIFVTVQDHLKTNALADRVAVLCDVNDYQTVQDADGGDSTLLTFNEVSFYEHPFNPTISTANRKTNYKGWIADDIFCYINFTTNTSILNSINIKLNCRNTVTGKEFTMLDNFIPCNDAIINGIRQVALDTTQGFKLISGSIHNYKKLELGTTDGTNQEYILQLGIKIRWEDYIPLMLANNDFWDSTKQYNGKNCKLNNYCNTVSNWVTEIEIEAKAEDSNGLESTFKNRSELQIYDYFKDNNQTPLWSAALELFEDSTSLGTGTNAKISNVKDTKVVVTFTTLPTNPINTTAIYGIIRIEEFENGGLLNIFEISTEENRLITANPLYPVTGSTRAKLTIIDTKTLKIECMIDKDLIDINKKYSIFARIGSSCEEIEGIIANNTINVGRGGMAQIGYTYFIDVTFPDVGTITDIAVSPQTETGLIDAIKGTGTDYVVSINGIDNTITVSAPETGTAYNTLTASIILKDRAGILINTFNFTLADGEDTIECEPYIPEVTNYLMINDTDYLLLNTNTDNNKLNIN